MNNNIFTGNTDTKISNKYISFEIPKQNVLIESKDKLLILIDNNMQTVFWANKKQCSTLNEFKLSFNISFNLEAYKGVAPYLQIFKNNQKESIGKISPTDLEKFFRKVG